MSNEQEILNLIARYTHYVDQGDFDAVGSLFTDGKIIAAGGSMEGKEGVAKQLTKNLQVYTDGTPRTAHVTTNTVLDIQEGKDQASAVSYLTIYQQDQERDFPLQPIAVGRYHDTFQRKNGQWHFSLRELIITLAGDLSHHANPEVIKLENL
ncbi:nuclear transport factor 2 family protein [Sinomicrobium sp. M5D2P17]